MKKTWQLHQAKAKLGDLVRRAESDGPQEITVRGRPTAVVLSKADFERLTGKKPSFVEFMRSSPLVGVELDIRRNDTPWDRVKDLVGSIEGSGDLSVDAGARVARMLRNRTKNAKKK